MQYVNGISTNEMIYQTARQLFHQNGYKATTYAMIADAASVPVGLVNYHYKKQDFVTRLYCDYIMNIRAFIKQQAQNRLENELQNHILMSHIMLTQIFSDSKTLAFHMEIESQKLITQDVHDLVRAHQVQILKDFQVPITSSYYYWCATAEYGGRTELIRQNLHLRPDSVKFQQLLDLLSTITVRIAGLSPSIIDDNLKKTNAVFQSLDYQDIHMF